MRAMILPRVVSLATCDTPLECVDLPTPTPGPSEVVLRIHACGVCHTELDEIEGRTAPRFLPIILGHEIVGTIAEVGKDVSDHYVGLRVGVGWIHASCGGETENLSADFRATGRDAHGGYAEYMSVPFDYTYRIPEIFSDVQAAPLLCAGAIGYRALRLAGIGNGDLLGLTGFGASAHLVLQLSKYLLPQSPVFVFARDVQSREFALQLGADWVGEIGESSPEPVHGIIDTTPAWKPIVEGLANLRPGGRLVINAIRKEDHDKNYLAKLSYADHLWLEKEIKSVANITARDIADFLPIAAAIPLRPEVETFPLEDANKALLALRRGGNRGAKVLVMHDTP